MIRGGAKWAEEASTLPAADVWALPEHKSDETRRESCKHADAAAFQPTHIIMLHHGRARERARARSKSCQSGGGAVGQPVASAHYQSEGGNTP